MKQFIVLVAMLVGSSSLTGTTDSSGKYDPRVKGVRAILIYGGELKKPVRIDDLESAAAIYSDMVDALRYEEVQTDLKARPCLGLAVFLHSPATANVPVAQLIPEQARFHYWLYPRFKQRAPGLASPNRAVHIPPRLLASLSNYGVPVEGTANSGRACDRGWP
jgi:hypothetical protein